MGGRSISQGAVIAAPGASAAAMAWRFRGELHVTVVGKATFAFSSDAPMTRAAPRPIFRDDVHHGNHPARSIRFSSDMVPRLGRADVLLTGYAHPPPTRKGEAAPVRLGVFDSVTPRLAKTLLVRRKPGSQGPVPIVYERAYGGIGWSDNPFGVGYSPGSGEPEIFTTGDPTELAGFGPIGRAWPRRRRLAGNLPKDALRAPILDLPDAFQWEYFQAAPQDQQIPFLKGDEWLVLDSLHPTAPRLRMRLPLVHGMARVTGLPWANGADAQMLDLMLDQLHIDGDERVVTATLRSSFVLSSEDALPELRFVVGVASQANPIDWPVEVEPEEEENPFEATIALASPSPAKGRSLEATLTLDEDDLIPVSSVSVSVDARSVEAMSVAASELLDEETIPPHSWRTDTNVLVPDLPAPTLPFKPGPSPLEKPGVGSPARRGDRFGSTVTLEPSDFEEDKQVIPFARPGDAAIPHVAPRAMAPEPANVPVQPQAMEPPPPVNVPVAAQPNVPVPAAETPPKEAPKAESPWAAPMDAPPPPAASKQPPPPVSPPMAAPSLKRGLYNRFSKH